tara:strand:+ start:126 stop:887 length:762 start_codon:yes stop_codon:yes gene_type:complete
MLKKTPKQVQQNNGFLIVATVSKAYYVAAINLVNSILDFYPEAKITLFTEPELFDEQHRKLFDVVDLSAPHHKRAKLFALPKTSYDITAYIDADCEVRDEEISNIFDQLGKNDIVLTKIRAYSGADLVISDTETMYWHCGVFVYNNKKKTLQMMQDWWTEYDLQLSCTEWLWPQHSESMRLWDQYTFYRLYTSKKYKTVKIDVFPGEDARWNYVFNYKPEEITKDPIIFHYSLSSQSIDAGNINKKPDVNTDS